MKVEINMIKWFAIGYVALTCWRVAKINKRLKKIEKRIK